MFETNEDDSPVKLIDFGVARKHSKDSFEKYMSTVVGTSFFIAPEVLGERLTTRVIYGHWVLLHMSCYVVIHHSMGGVIERYA